MFRLLKRTGNDLIAGLWELKESPPETVGLLD